MPRPKYQTLTEQMFYCLLALRRECCGTDIMEKVPTLSGGRVTVGSGTLYHLLDQFLASGMIFETKVEGRRRSYLLTQKGEQALGEEARRLARQLEDYKRVMADYQAATEENNR